MTDISRVLKIKCDTLEEVEVVVQELREIPEIIIISGITFSRNDCYRGTCNEYFSYWKINNHEAGEEVYSFCVTNGSRYLDGKFDVHSYNFLKYEKLEEVR